MTALQPAAPEFQLSERHWLDSDPDHVGDRPMRKRSLMLEGESVVHEDGSRETIRVELLEEDIGIHGERSLLFELDLTGVDADGEAAFGDVGVYCSLPPRALPFLVAALQRLSAQADERGWTRPIEP